MKNKLLLMLSTFLFASCIFGQTFPTINKTVNMKHSGDSISGNGGGKDTLYSQVQKSFKSVSVQVVITKSTGTLTAATHATLVASNDGLNYVTLGTTTFSVTNTTTQSYCWVTERAPYEYYGVIVTAGASDTAKIKIYGYILGSNVSGFANKVIGMSSAYGKNLDTVTNTATNFLIVKASQWYESVSIQAVVTKISGTAAGTVTLQGSNDGVNYSTVNTGYLSNDVGAAPYTTGGGATLSVTNVTTNSKIFVLRGSPYLYYKLSYTGSGTMVCTLSGYVLGQK